MTALITVKRGKRIIAKCDERCYEAQIIGEGCNCVCCGELHGLGAVEAGNHLIRCQSKVKASVLERFGNNATVEFNVGAYQPKLPLF